MDKHSDTAEPEVGEVRYDYIGPLRVMACVDGYLMVRRPRCIPFILTIKNWRKLESTNALVGKSAAPRAMHYGVLS